MQQNRNDDIVDTTGQAFSMYSDSLESLKESLRVLTQLRGIGPASASLIMSVYQPARIPFFSDELFRWCFYEQGKGQGWDRKIRYTIKEYLDLFDKVGSFVARFKAAFSEEVEVVSMEKVAYVLAKSGSGSMPEVDGPAKRKPIAGDNVQNPPGQGQ